MNVSNFKIDMDGTQNISDTLSSSLSTLSHYARTKGPSLKTSVCYCLHLH